MEQNTNTNWKSYVDWWPTYIVIGISLAYLVHQTGIVQKLTSKLLKKDEDDFVDSQNEY
jgi:hypothetical protein